MKVPTALIAILIVAACGGGSADKAAEPFEAANSAFAADLQTAVEATAGRSDLATFKTIHAAIAASLSRYIDALDAISFPSTAKGDAETHMRYLDAMQRAAAAAWKVTDAKGMEKFTYELNQNAEYVFEATSVLASDLGISADDVCGGVEPLTDTDADRRGEDPSTIVRARA